MSKRHVEARGGAYADSVTLMQVSTNVQAVAGVRSALVAMATELNLGLLANLGMAAPDPVSRNDLLVAIEADDAESLATALAVAEAALTARPGGAGAGAAGAGAEAGGPAGLPPRTVRNAARRSGSGLALISVPGQSAFAEAIDALDAGCDVMIFSDNVPVEQEIALKDLATRRGLLVMGPDCGTAIVAGVGLGFSHAVPGGPIGVVAASGTGAQQVVSLLDASGAGVSAVLGVGGRDLSAAVGGRSARAALAALDADPGCELIVLLSKPPAPEVAAELRGYAATLATPVQFALIGPGQPDLTAAAEAALRATGREVPDWPCWPAGQAERDARLPLRPGSLRGLFAGGTLCDEAMVIAAQRLGGPVYSNIPLRPDWRLDSTDTAEGHVMIDFGDDELTAGRPHPMIDQRLRLDQLAAQAADVRTAVIMLDVVLGYGAHPDPAAELAPAIAAARAAASAAGCDLPVIVSLVGTKSDPQGLQRQAAALAGAGAHVFASNAQAARFACDLTETAGADEAAAEGVAGVRAAGEEGPAGPAGHPGVSR